MKPVDSERALKVIEARKNGSAGKMDYSELKEGTRIYYTGDRANQPSFGTIEKVNPPSKYAPLNYDIRFDEDGKVHRGIYYLSFTPGPGRRFYPLTEWQEERRQRLEQMKRDMERIHGLKGGEING
jgi:hypothetical protein